MSGQTIELDKAKAVGIEKGDIGAGKLDCGGCDGSGLARVPKMRVQCNCGVRQPRATSVFTQPIRRHGDLEHG